MPRSIFLFSVIVVLMLAVACGRKKAAETTVVEEVEQHVSYGEFVPVGAQSLLEASLPLVFDKENKLVENCLAKAEGLAEPVPSEAQLAIIEKNEEQLTALAMEWLVNALSETGITKEIADTWNVALVDFAALSLTEEQLRFAPKPECIDSETKWFPLSMNVVGTLYGAASFKFSTDVPMGGAIQEKMLAHLRSLGATVNVASILFYEPAMDKNGAPMLSFNNEKLFTSPEGEFVPQKDIPPVDQRPAKEWTVRLEQPFFWAAGEFPAVWKNGINPDVCDSFLIWDDPAPRKPDCEEFKESGFAVSYIEDTDEVYITVTSYGTNVGAVLTYDETTMIRAEDNVLVWVTPKKIEEGVLLLSDSFVLRAGPEQPVEEAVATPETAPAAETKEEPAVEDVVKAALEAEAKEEAAKAKAAKKAQSKKKNTIDLPK